MSEQVRPFEPRIVALVCNWCTYAGADMAGTTRRTYPATVRTLKVPCTGRINPLTVIRAFEQGADGVLVSGCHPGDCHYVQGNLFARRRFAAFRALVEFLGLDPRRLHFSWVSASEGIKWAKVVSDVTDAVREAGPLAEWTARARPVDVPRRLPDAPPPPRSAAQAEEHAAVAGHLRQLAASLLAEGKASVVVGYKRGLLPGQMVPTFVGRPEDAASLDWNDGCAANLATYLAGPARQTGKVAVVLKACDARAVVGLLQEEQVRREDLVLIGVSCPGVSTGGSLALKCYACDGETARVADFTITPQGVRPGAVKSEAARPTAPDPRDAQIAFLEALGPHERWAFWHNEFERCLRCYACRAVCPLCYCGSCVAEQHRPQWVPVAIDAQGNAAWNAVRAYHLAGRCAGCDECSRVCPARLRLDLVNRRVALEIERRFGHRAGEDPTSAPPLAVFRADDAQEFIY